MALGGDHVHGVLQRTDDGGKVFPRGIKAAGADIVAYRAPGPAGRDVSARLF